MYASIKFSAKEVLGNFWHVQSPFVFLTRSRIPECTISLRFLGIILRVLRLEVSVYNVYT